jgi:hypothetical protein
MRGLIAVLVSLTVGLPAPAVASSITVVPKSKPPTEPESPPPADPAPPAPAPDAAPTPPKELDLELRRLPTPITEPPQPARRFNPWPLVGIGASAALAVVGVVFLVDASDELNRDFTFPSEENDDGTIDVEVPPEFIDAQRNVIVNGFLGTLFLSAAASVLTLSVVELFRD